MIRNVAVPVCHGTSPFELGVICEVFGIDRSESGLPTYDFALVAVDEPPIRSKSGFTIDTPYRLDRLAEADLIAVPAWPDDTHAPEPLLQALRDAVARG